MTLEEKWNKLIEIIKSDVKGFEVKDKLNSKLYNLLDKILFFTDPLMSWTAIYPKVWRPLAVTDLQKYNISAIQHEWTHLKDAQTFFGLLPKSIKYLNITLYSLAYAFPQILAGLSLLAFINLWWLLCLLFLLPWPAPFKWLAEVRAYRRNIEIGKRDPEKLADNFVTGRYYWCWPFKQLTLKMLKKPSPYKEEMDKSLE